jgi:hypothetical protein
VHVGQHTSAYVSIRQRMSTRGARGGGRRSACRAPQCKSRPAAPARAPARSAYVSIRQHTLHTCGGGGGALLQATSARERKRRILQRQATYVSIRQHTSAYVSIRCTSTAKAHTLISFWYAAYAAYVSTAHVSIRQHTSACGGIRQHTLAYLEEGGVEFALEAIRQNTTVCA